MSFEMKQYLYCKKEDGRENDFESLQQRNTMHKES
jgi:hypothetical protein